MSLYLRGRIWYYRFQFKGGIHQGSTFTDSKKLAKEYQECQKVAAYKEWLNPEKTCSLTLETGYKRLYDERWKDQKDAAGQVSKAHKIGEILGQEMPLDKVDGAAVSKLRAVLSERVSPTTINRYMANLQVLMNTAKTEWEVIDRVPHFRLTKEHKRVRTISPEEFSLMKGQIKDEGRVEFFEVLLEAGMRLSELLTLKTSQVDIKGKLIHLHGDRTKSSEDRFVPLTNKAVSILSKRLEGDRVFDYRKPQIDKTWSRARAALGITEKGFGIHALRHTYGTTLAEKGVSASIIKDLMGHACITTTQIYLNHETSSLSNAVDVLN